jgi:uncharacterized Zn-finger protein
MQPFETIYVDRTEVACDGGGGVGGHPRVFLNLAGKGQVECPYCSRLFIRRPPGAGPKIETPAPPEP